jgi:drug/metabolite transporter (DMT)-like permease
VAGLAVAASIVYSKRLSEAGFSPRSVMSVRFFVAIAASWIAVAVASHPHVTAALVPGVNLALISTVVPLYLLQLGIKHAEPITVSLLVCLGPGFTLALQLLDSRLRVSPLSVGATLGIMILVALGVLARHRSTVRV